MLHLIIGLLLVCIIIKFFGHIAAWVVGLVATGGVVLVLIALAMQH